MKRFSIAFFVVLLGLPVFADEVNPVSEKDVIVSLIDLQLFPIRDFYLSEITLHFCSQMGTVQNGEECRTEADAFIRQIEAAKMMAWRLDESKDADERRATLGVIGELIGQYRLAYTAWNQKYFPDGIRMLEDQRYMRSRALPKMEEEL